MRGGERRGSLTIPALFLKTASCRPENSLTFLDAARVAWEGLGSSARLVASPARGGSGHQRRVRCAAAQLARSRGTMFPG